MLDWFYFNDFPSFLYIIFLIMGLKFVAQYIDVSKNIILKESKNKNKKNNTDTHTDLDSTTCHKKDYTVVKMYKKDLEDMVHKIKNLQKTIDKL